MSTETDPTHDKPRLRVQLTTPRGSIHEADESLSDSLIGLINRGQNGGDKKDLLDAMESLMDLGTRMVMRVAKSFLRSLRG